MPRRPANRTMPPKDSTGRAEPRPRIAIPLYRAPSPGATSRGGPVKVTGRDPRRKNG